MFLTIQAQEMKTSSFTSGNSLSIQKKDTSVIDALGAFLHCAAKARDDLDAGAARSAMRLLLMPLMLSRSALQCKELQPPRYSYHPITQN